MHKDCMQGRGVGGGQEESALTVMSPLKRLLSPPASSQMKVLPADKFPAIVSWTLPSKTEP